jgi:hypothetical protein
MLDLERLLGFLVLVEAGLLAADREHREGGEQGEEGASHGVYY